MTAPLTDQRLDEIEALLPTVFSNPWRVEHDPKGFAVVMDNALPVASISYNVEELAPFIAAAPHIVTDLLDEVRRLRAENEQLADFDAAATRRAVFQAERDRAVQWWHDEHKRAEKAEAALADVAGYLAAVHRHANRHDVLGAGLGCAGCALLARIEGVQAETRHFSPSYPGEFPDHLGRADACPMPACAASRGPAARTADTEENR